MSTTILLADDHKLMREGLRTLITEQPDMTVIGEAKDGHSAVQLALRHSPDVIIMDISMPGLNGIEATRQIRGASPATRIMALSMHMEVRMVLEMITAGAAGYLLKDCAFEDVILAIHALASNSYYLSQKIADTIIQDYIHLLSGSEAPLTDLSAKKREVLHLLVEGRSAKEIGAMLCMSLKAAEFLRMKVMFDHIVPYLNETYENKGVSPAMALTIREKEILLWVRDGKSTWEVASILGISKDTVKFHMKNIFKKLNASSRSQAVTIALDNKLMEL